jgi:hypothetical protein
VGVAADGDEATCDGLDMEAMKLLKVRSKSDFI